MAHRDAKVFQIVSENERRVRCIFCGWLISFKSANRHRSNCHQYKKYVARMADVIKKINRLKRLKVQLSTATKEIPRKQGERRKSFKNMGRFIEESTIAENELYGTLNLVQTIFDLRVGDVPHLVVQTMSFLPITYVDDRNMQGIIVVDDEIEEL
jgi:hypothetical protein